MKTSEMRANPGRDFTGGREKNEWVKGGHRQKGNREREQGGEKWRGKRRAGVGRDNQGGAAERGHGGTMSSAVVPAGVRQVHLMTHLSV